MQQLDTMKGLMGVLPRKVHLGILCCIETQSIYNIHSHLLFVEVVDKLIKDFIFCFITFSNSLFELKRDKVETELQIDSSVYLELRNSHIVYLKKL